MPVTAMTTLKERMEAIKAEMREAAKQGLKDVFAQFFEQWPEAQAIQWTQYTPYFNDGEACVFGVNEAYVKIGEEGGDDDDGFMHAYGFADKSPERVRMKGLNDDLESCQDALQSLFGDHCKVTVWRGKADAEVEEYDHD